MINYNIIDNKYICIKIGDFTDLLNKMNEVIYVYKNGTLLCPIPRKIILSKLQKIFPELSYQTLMKSVKNKLLSIDDNEYTFECGKDAVNKIISLGNGNVLNYTPDENIQPETIIIDYDKYKSFITPVENIINDNSNFIIKYDIYGNYIDKINFVPDSKNMFIYRLLSNEVFSHEDMYFYCRQGKEQEISSKLKYIYYKYDDDGTIIDASPFLWKLINKEIDPSITSGRKILKIKKKFYSYLNTGVKSPNGFYYRQGIEPIDNDPDNTELKKKREEIKWVPKKKKIRKPKKTIK